MPAPTLAPPTLRAARTPLPPRPVLLAPTACRPADAALATFAWAEPQPGQRFQLAADRAFEQVLWDVPAAGLTQLTLQGALPATERPYYWRVGRAGAWSAPATFHATTDDAVAAWEWARHEATVRAARAAQRAREAAEGRDAEAASPHLTGATSRAEVLLWVYGLLASFGLALLLIVWALGR